MVADSLAAVVDSFAVAADSSAAVADSSVPAVDIEAEQVAVAETVDTLAVVAGNFAAAHTHRQQYHC